MNRRALPLPIAVLLAAGAAVALSLFLSARRNAWLFTGEKARPYEADQLRWWFVLLPLALGAVVIASVTAIAALRHLRRRAYSHAWSSVAIGILGVAAVAAALSAGNQWRMLQRQPKPRPRPLYHFDVFVPEQWSDLAYRLRDRYPERPRVRSTGVGLEGHPGVIPLDAFLLKRFSFAGLTEEEVFALLGPAVPQEGPSGTRELRYAMLAAPADVYAYLILRFEKNKGGNWVVASENLNETRPRY